LQKGGHKGIDHRAGTRPGRVGNPALHLDVVAIPCVQERGLRVNAHQLGKALQGVEVDALVSMRSVYAEDDEGRAHVIARLQGGGAVETVAAMLALVKIQLGDLGPLLTAMFRRLAPGLGCAFQLAVIADFLDHLI